MRVAVLLLIAGGIAFWALSRWPDVHSIAPPEGFDLVASGQSSGLRWALSRKPGPDGGTCWHLDSEPKLKQLQSDTECLRERDPQRSRAYDTEFPFGTDASGEYDIVVAIVADRVKAARFGFDDGSRAEPTYLGPDTGIVVWAGASRPFITGAVITLADGAQLGCGPGDISRPSELEGRSEDDLLDIRQFVWTCLDL